MSVRNCQKWAALSAVLLLGATTTIEVVPRAGAQSAPDKLAYGKHLSQECTTCHRRDGADKGIPSIIGLDPDFFVTTMKFYQTGARDNQTMNSVAQALNEEQLQALAAYFSTLKPEAKAAKGAKGKK